MKCEEKQSCSLHLKVSSTVQITEHVRGVSSCVTAAGMLQHCTQLSFSRVDRRRLAGRQVEIQNGCFEVGAGQQLEVTLKTVPRYCSLTWSRRYQVQDCNNEDLRTNVPECITGEISYVVDADRKELSVTVTGMLENEDYNLRLCYKGFTCRGAGPYALIKKENPLKNATFRYSRSLPCLCIEGWSRVIDAPRVQVCPFRNRTEELWSGVTFDPKEEVLSWEPLCSVEVVVTLCRALRGDSCLDLANSTRVVNRDKVAYSRVDPHPQLCMKFTTGDGSWIKCPFSSEKFTAWSFEVKAGDGLQQALLTSKMQVHLSVSLCRTDRLFDCSAMTSVAVEKLKRAAVNLTLGTDICNSTVCVQVRRIDVQFSAPVSWCHLQCTNASPAHARGDHWKVEHVLLLALMCLTVALLVSLLANITLIVFQRRSLKRVCGTAPAPRLISKVEFRYSREGGTSPEHPCLTQDLEKFLTGLSPSGQMERAEWAEQVAFGEPWDVPILHPPEGCTGELERLLRVRAGQTGPAADGL